VEQNFRNRPENGNGSIVTEQEWKAMRIIIEKVSEEEWGQPYIARSVETKDKKEYVRLLRFPEEYESFHILDAEYYHKEKISEVVFPCGTLTKKRDEFTNIRSGFP